MPLRDDFQSLEQIVALHRMGFEIMRLFACKLLKPPVLSFDFQDHFVEIYKVFLRAAVLAAGLKFSAFSRDGRNKSRICYRAADADVRMEPQAEILSFHKSKSTLYSGHVGHDADRTDKPVVDCLRDPVIHGFAIAEIVCSY